MNAVVPERGGHPQRTEPPAAFRALLWLTVLAAAFQRPVLDYTQSLSLQHRPAPYQPPMHRGC